MVVMVVVATKGCVPGVLYEVVVVGAEVAVLAEAVAMVAMVVMMMGLWTL